jgi:hypothetical protein
MTDLLKIMAAATIGFVAFIAITAFAPIMAFEGLGPLNLAIRFAIVFLAGTIALRLGRFINRRFGTSLPSRTFVLSLGGATLVWLGYAGMAGTATPVALILSVIADGLAVLAIWWQSGATERD